MLERADELADEMAAQIRAAVAVYRSDEVVTAAELRRTCRENIDVIFGPAGPGTALTSRENGRRRALAGVPLTAVMEAYRVSGRFLWEQLARAAATGEVTADVALTAASGMWLVVDTFTAEMADGYREEMTSQIITREAERSAVMPALLDGRLDEIGIAAHPRPDEFVTVAQGRVGFSPPYPDLRQTADAVRLARIALRGTCDSEKVVVFDRAPLAIAAVAEPHLMRSVAAFVLGALNRDRALLLDTFGAWLDAGGSADRAAAALFCHPNTIRHRLRRIEERTGRSLAEPRELAELTLAYEIDRRAPVTGGVQ